MNTSLYSNQESINSVLSSIDSSISSIGSYNPKNKKQQPQQQNIPRQPLNSISNNNKKPSTAHSQNHKKLSLSCFNEPDPQSENNNLQVKIDTVLSETNQDNFETDFKDRQIIETNENWPVYSFCFKLIDTLVDNMSTLVLKNNKQASSVPDTSLLPIICETINNLIVILYETKGEWSTLNLNDTLMGLLKKLNFNIKYCHKRLANNGSVNSSIQTMNRLVQIYFIVILYKFINLMNSSNEVSDGVGLVFWLVL